MAGFRLTCACIVDGTTVPGFPYNRRIDADDVRDLARVRAGDGTGVTTYSEVVPTTASALRATVLGTDAPLVLVLNGVPPDVAALSVTGGGLLVLQDVFATSPTGHLRAANPTTTTANVDVLVAQDH